MWYSLLLQSSTHHQQEEAQRREQQQQQQRLPRPSPRQHRAPANKEVPHGGIRINKNSNAATAAAAAAADEDDGEGTVQMKNDIDAMLQRHQEQLPLQNRRESSLLVPPRRDSYSTITTAPDTPKLILEFRELLQIDDEVFLPIEICFYRDGGGGGGAEDFSPPDEHDPMNVGDFYNDDDEEIVFVPPCAVTTATATATATVTKAKTKTKAKAHHPSSDYTNYCLYDDDDDDDDDADSFDSVSASTGGSIYSSSCWAPLDDDDDSLESLEYGHDPSSSNQRSYKQVVPPAPAFSQPHQDHPSSSLSSASSLQPEPPTLRRKPSDGLNGMLPPSRHHLCTGGSRTRTRTPRTRTCTRTGDELRAGVTRKGTPRHHHHHHHYYCHDRGGFFPITRIEI